MHTPDLQQAITCAALVLACSGAQAQLGGLPRVQMPELSRLPAPRLTEPLQGTTLPVLQEVRAAAVRTLLRDHPRSVEAGPGGAPIRRRELLLIEPSQDLLDAALARGFTVLRDDTPTGLPLRHIVLQAPPRVPTAQALETLRAIDPQAEIDFNHVYTTGGQVGTSTGHGARPAAAADAAADAAAAAGPGPESGCAWA